MHRSFPITVAGHLAGAAVTHDDRFRFIAVDPRAEELDESLWPSVAAVEQVDQVTQRLVRSTSAERAALGVMHPGRADVIAGGALVLRTLMRKIGASEVTASEHDILDGIAASIA